MHRSSRSKSLAFVLAAAAALSCAALVAAWALGAIGDKRAVAPLTETLRRDAAESAREQAAWALGAIGDRGATEALGAALKDASADVREQAAWSLGAIGEARAVEG